MKMPRTGRFFNRRTNRTTVEGHVLKSQREILEYEGYTVYWGWKNVPADLYSASRAKRARKDIDPEPVAYVEDEYHYITALYYVISGYDDER